MPLQEEPLGEIPRIVTPLKWQVVDLDTDTQLHIKKGESKQVSDIKISVDALGAVTVEKVPTDVVIGKRMGFEIVRKPNGDISFRRASIGG